MTIEDIALTMTPGIGVKGVVHLLDVFGDAAHIFAATEDELIGRGELRGELVRELVGRVGFAGAERELKWCAKHGVRAVASTDAEYPSLLREIPDYPHVLYVQGNVAALSWRCVSMVGTRRATPYGQQMCIELVRGLAERVPELCVVSGLAFGVDVACHRAALAANVATVAVLPCPLPEVIPVQHTAVARDILESGGALVTELHSQVKQKGTFYLARNRIVAGLSAGTVVVESPSGGGSLSTASYADDYNRSVMAVPGRVTDRQSWGTNRLICNKKARLILTAEDIIEELMWDMDLPVTSNAGRGVIAPEFTTDEARIMACFNSSDSVSVESIGVACGMTPGELSVLLLGLEMTGVLRQVPGNMYMKLI